MFAGPLFLPEVAAARTPVWQRARLCMPVLTGAGAGQSLLVKVERSTRVARRSVNRPDLVEGHRLASAVFNLALDGECLFVIPQGRLEFAKLVVHLPKLVQSYRFGTPVA